MLRPRSMFMLSLPEQEPDDAEESQGPPQQQYCREVHSIDRPAYPCRKRDTDQRIAACPRPSARKPPISWLLLRCVSRRIPPSSTPRSRSTESPLLLTPTSGHLSSPSSPPSPLQAPHGEPTRRRPHAVILPDLFPSIFLPVQTTLIAQLSSFHLFALLRYNRCSQPHLPVDQPFRQPTSTRSGVLIATAHALVSASRLPPN